LSVQGEQKNMSSAIHGLIVLNAAFY